MVKLEREYSMSIKEELEVSYLLLRWNYRRCQNYKRYQVMSFGKDFLYVKRWPICYLTLELCIH